MAIERVGTRHPECCQGTTPAGPCEYRSVEGTSFCPLHKGGVVKNGQDREKLRNYKLQSLQYAERAGELVSSPGLKSLRDEIALSRLLAENLVNMAQDNKQLMLYTDKLMSIFTNLKGMIESSTKLEERTKELIDRVTLMRIIDNMVGVLCVRIDDPDLLRLLSDELYECFVKGVSGEDAASIGA